VVVFQRQYMASGEANYASRRLGLGDAVLHEAGTSGAVFTYSNARAVLLRRFSSAFTTT